MIARRVWRITVAALALTASHAAAQRTAETADSVPTGQVVGTVLDAVSGQPLAGAIVMLLPQPGSIVTPAGGASPFWSSGVSTTTDGSGGYRFGRIPAGMYRLRVRRLGYQAASIDLDMRQPTQLRVSVGLLVHPILLEPAGIEVPRSPYARRASLGGDETDVRLAAERVRQQRFLASDTRTLTHADVVDAVTLGETDLFRAFQRLPGVTTRDDFTAELWTRGAPWSQTRVYFDGFPLFNPVHTGGVFTGINPDALGAVDFMPGVRSADIGEGAAAVLDLTSRASTGGDMGGFGELSVVSARAALDGRLGSHGGWMLAARRSYVDLLSDLFADSTTAIPYAFYDIAGRTDLPVGTGGVLTVSGMWERDGVHGNVRDLLRNNTGAWGNGVLQSTLTLPLGPVYLRESVGASGFSGDVQLHTVALATTDSGVRAVATSAPTANSITYVASRTSLLPGGAADDDWAAGWDVSVQRQHYRGPLPRPYPSAILFDTLTLDASLVVPALWAERRVRSGSWQAEGGVRLEAPNHGTNAGHAAVAPRLDVRWTITPAVAVSAGAGRSFQYSQAIAPAGPGVGPDLHLTDVWLMTNDTIPVIRTDIATLGAETWLGNGWLGAVNAYVRHATGVAVPDPRPGAFSRLRPILVVATNDAEGLEMSVRRLAGRWTGSLAYTLGRSDLSTLGYHYPSSADRRHAVDATAMVRMSPALRLGGALTVASGAPFTRFLLVSSTPCDSAGIICEATTTAQDIQDPNANRTRPYITFDLLADWSHNFHGWTIDAYAQIRNALNRRNAVTYVGSYEGCTPEPGDVVPWPGVCDKFDRGIPLLPLVGVSVAF